MPFGSRTKLNLIWMTNDLMVSHFSLTKTVNLENYGKAGESKDLTFFPNEIQSLSLHITMFLSVSLGSHKTILFLSAKLQTTNKRTKLFSNELYARDHKSKNAQPAPKSISRKKINLAWIYKE